ncbi:MAG TPA: helix-turn-helix domain-containing protein [Candidatus Limnocylindria bacterium]|jgi:cytoskeleton protein RodZ
MTGAGQTLGQTLRAAREGKGWDLARAERDTRIRARYLAALEAGDYADLPSTVYTRGFVRNYATYLGLDPEWCVDRYRLETEPAARGRSRFRPAPIITPPRHGPIEPRGGVIFTTARLVRIGLLLLVVALVAYLGYQFLTFAGTPELTLTDPATDLAAYAGTSYLLRGETVPDAEITVDGLRENPTATASDTGVFTIRVELLPGSNVITLVATDPVTGRSSNPVTRTITVSLDAATPLPGGAPNLTSPEADAVIAGPVTVAGSAAPGASVTVRPALVGAPTPSFEITNLAGQTVRVPAWSPVAPDPVAVSTDLDGSFSMSLSLGIGTWELRASAAAPAASGAASAPPAVETIRRVTVVSAAGLSGTLEVRDATAAIVIEEDGVPKAGVSGTDQPAGTQLTLRADERIRLRVGDGARVHLVLNGYVISPMGPAGSAVEWSIRALVPGG